MNVFIGSGRLVKDAIVHGAEKKALKFTIAAKYGYDKECGSPHPSATDRQN